MGKLVSKEKCSGCSSCKSICAHNAISMISDDKGFKYPYIDETLCINCNMCSKVCPSINDSFIEKDIKVYACYNKNFQERINSSSGGCFILLAKEILKLGGVVFGAAFDDKNVVKHFYIEKEEEISQFMGSKYVQSDIGDCFVSVKNFLKNDKYVLFTGTPCQINGLLNYLGKDYPKLYTQDFICHGVPSPLIWEKYILYLSKGGRISDISFRNKDNGWKNFNVSYLKSGEKQSVIHKEDPFMKLFLNDIILRDSCYNCSSKTVYRKSDITLADYWGVHIAHPEMDDDKGTSVVLVNTEKGHEIFNKIKSNLVYIESDIKNIELYNKSISKSAVKNKYRDKVFKTINIDNFSRISNKYTKIPLFKWFKYKLHGLMKRLLPIFIK